MLKNIIKKPYYYIPPCPCCNSNQTGHYVKELGLDPSFTVRESLKNGELAIAVREIPYENVFCLECGFTWHQDIKIKMLRRLFMTSNELIYLSTSFKLYLLSCIITH